jgi:hypothetical protein
MRATDGAYVAGLFDGEGCVRWADTPRVSITSCWPHHLHWIKRTFGFGNVRLIPSQSPNHRTAYRWEASGKNAVTFLEAIRPFLREKAHQADLLIRLVKYPASAAIRERMIEQLKEHKKIDYGPA